MKKKIISLIVAVILTFCSVSPVCARANSYDDYNKNEKKMIVSNYVNIKELMTKRFYTPENLAYWSCIEEIADSKFNKAAIEVASYLIDENVDKEQCTEFLINLYMMQQLELEKAINQQSEYDDLTDIKHYLKRIGKICLSGLSAKGEEAFEAITTVLGAMDTTGEFYENYGNAMKYYTYIAANYQGIERMCSAIEKYAQSGSLRRAAKELKSVGTKLSDEQMSALGGMVLKDLESFDPLSYTMELLPDILNTRSMSKEEEEICKKLDACGQVLASINFGFEAGMLFGDAVFHTTNTFKRYQEMKIMADISQCMVKGMEELKIRDNKITDSNLDGINEWCAYNRILLTTHARGEYLIQQLVTKDGGIQSNIHIIKECSKILAGKHEMTVDQWHEEQNKFFLYYMELVNSVFNVSLYDQYSAVIKEREEKFGEMKVHMLDSGRKYMTGLCFLSLIDFNKDGTEELLLAFCKDTGSFDPTGNSYQYEVWGPIEGSVTLLDTGTPCGYDGGVKEIELYEKDNNIYLMTGGMDSFYNLYFHGYDKDEFGIVKSLEYYDGEPEGKIDGKTVNVEKAKEQRNIWCSNQVGNYELNYDDDKKVSRLINETKEKLEMERE